MNGANSFTGSTTVTGSTLQIGNGVAHGGMASASVSNSGALVFDVPDTTTYPGTISGPAHCSSTAQGTVILTGSNTSPGNATISSGTLQIGDGSTPGEIFAAANVSNSGALVFNVPDTTTYSGKIAGPGPLLVAGPGTLALSGSNNFTGGTTIANGTLQVISSYALADGSALYVGDTSQFSPIEGLSSDGAGNAGAAAAMSAVPEPASCVLLVFLAGILSVFKFLRRCRAATL